MDAKKKRDKHCDGDQEQTSTHSEEDGERLGLESQHEEDDA